MEGAHQVIGTGLGRGVGRIRRVLGLLCESPRSPQAPVNLVRRNMEETEALVVPRRQTLPPVQRALQQVQGADDIGLHESRRAVDRTVHMAFGREVDDG